MYIFWKYINSAYIKIIFIIFRDASSCLYDIVFQYYPISNLISYDLPTKFLV
jgi:hypothetical protein